MKGKKEKPAAKPAPKKTSVAPAAADEEVPTYRTDRGESLPPQETGK